MAARTTRGKKAARGRVAAKKPAGARGARGGSASRLRKSAARPARKASPAKRPVRKAPARSPTAGKAATRTAAVRRAEAVRRQLEKARVGTFEELFTSSTPEVQSIGYKLRELVYEIIPDASETVYLGMKIALYKKEVEICGIQPAGDRCNFYLTRGVYLLDPEGLLEGSGKRLRHVKVRSVVCMAAQGIRDLLKQAVALPLT